MTALLYLFPDLRNNLLFDVYWHRAIFILSPILLLGLYGFWLMRKQNEIKKFILPLLFTFLSQVIIYARWIEWHGGFCWGSRQLLPVIPLIVIPIYLIIDKYSANRNYRGLLIIFGFISLITSLIGALILGKLLTVIVNASDSVPPLR